MAYSKTPEKDTHSQYRILPRGNQTIQSVSGDYATLIGSKYVNCFPQILESKTTEPRIVLVKAPSIQTKTWVFPDTDVGITAYDYDTGIFVYKHKIYRATATGPGGPTITLLKDSELAPTLTPGNFLSCQKVVDYSLTGDEIIAGLFHKTSDLAIYPYTFNASTVTLTIGTTAVASGSTIYSTPTGYSDEVYVTGTDETASPRDLIIDGYHIVGLKATRNGTNRVLSSVVTDYNNFSPTVDYFVPEIDPDDLVDIQKHRNFICVLGTKTIEFFYNAAIEIGSPFTRQENYTIRLGAAQNLTSNGGAVSVANGDDIYFFANALHGDNSIYMIRNFAATKISDDYIDFLLNSSTGIIQSVAPALAKLGLIDIMGNIHVGVEFTNTSTGLITTYVFNERDKIWWEWTNSDSSGLRPTTNGIVSNFSGQPFFIKGQQLGLSSNAQVSIAGATTGNDTTIQLYYVSKDPNKAAVTAYYSCPMQDLDNNNLKHIKSVDAIGDYGNNSIKLAWTTLPDYSQWYQLPTLFPTSPSVTEFTRWHNLGQARRFALSTTFIGDSNIAHDALEVKYNIRTQ